MRAPGKGSRQILESGIPWRRKLTECPQGVQGPAGVIAQGCQPEFVELGVAGGAGHDELLGVEAPELCGVSERRQALLERVERRPDGTAAPGWENPVDPTVLAVAVAGDERIARPPFVVGPVGVVVADRIVPVGDPYRTVLGLEQRRPAKTRRRQMRRGSVRTRTSKAWPGVGDLWCRDQVERWLADQGAPVRPPVGKPPAAVELMPSRRGKLLLRPVLEILGGNWKRQVPSESARGAFTGSSPAATKNRLGIERYQLGFPLAVEPIMSPWSVIASPQVLFVVPCKTSKAEPSARNRKTAISDWWTAPPDSTLRPL